jgi:hypothetical protein
VLAKIDPNGNCTSGINRVQTPVPDIEYGYPNDVPIKNLSRWPVERYLNIWIVRNIIGGFFEVLGFSSFPPGWDPLSDGIVIKHKYFGTSGTAT